MSVFSFADYDQHENVIFFNEPSSGLKAIIAIHNTHLGHALGGLRMYPYVSDEHALSDVLRLSRGMTYKAALANLPLGGGKSVIIGNPATDKTPALLAAMGRCVDSLCGRYIVAQDSGINVADLKIVGTQTTHISGISQRTDDTGQTHNGDPSPSTAYGVFLGIKAAVRHRLARDDLKGTRIAIQGLGNVGYRLARYLYQAGAQLWVSDINTDNLNRAQREFGAKVVHGDALFSLDVDIVAPCALGGPINQDTIDQLKACIIAGAASNQLLALACGDTLHQRGILYAPDYVINAGGIIDAYYLHNAKAYSEMKQHVETISTTLHNIFTQSAKYNQPTQAIAQALAQERLTQAAPEKIKAIANS